MTTGERSTPPIGVRRRLAWVDITRGLSIVLVMVLHTQGALTGAGMDASTTDAVNVPLATVRMPAFFLVSGLLAGGVLGRPWPEFLRRRPALFGYLYSLFGRQRVLTQVQRVSLLWVLAATAGWIAGTVLCQRLDHTGGLRQALMPLLGVPVMVGWSVLLGRRRGPAGRMLVHLGSLTLPVYVMHPLALAVIGAVCSVTGLHTGVLPLWLALPATLVVALAAIAGCLLAHRLLRRMPWLFALPGPPAHPGSR